MKTNKLIHGNSLSAARAAGKYLPVADVFAFLNNLADAFQEHQQTKRTVAEIEARREVLVAEISRRYDLYQNAFDKIFGERKLAIDRHFEIVERGVAANDKDLIIHGLQGVSSIVASSPFSNIQELAKLMESGRTLEF